MEDQGISNSLCRERPWGGFAQTLAAQQVGFESVWSGPSTYPTAMAHPLKSLVGYKGLLATGTHHQKGQPPTASFTESHPVAFRGQVATA